MASIFLLMSQMNKHILQSKTDGIQLSDLFEAYADCRTMTSFLGVDASFFSRYTAIYLRALLTQPFRHCMPMMWVALTKEN